LVLPPEPEFFCAPFWLPLLTAEVVTATLCVVTAVVVDRVVVVQATRQLTLVVVWVETVVIWLVKVVVAVTTTAPRHQAIDVGLRPLHEDTYWRRFPSA
jgi:hypothetical protein